MSRIIVIPCGGAKVAHRAPAHELYTGSMFRDQLNTALQLAPAANIRILSAKHGLLQLDELVDPYDLKMGDAGSISVEELSAQLSELDDELELEALLPKTYAAKLEAATDRPVLNYFAGTRGIGYQKAILRQLRQELAA